MNNNKLIYSVLLMTMLIIHSNSIGFDWKTPGFGGLFSENLRNMLIKSIAKFKSSMEQINSELEKINSQNYSDFELASVIYPDENDTSIHLSLGGCNCINQECNCCSHIEIDQLQLNQTGIF